MNAGWPSRVSASGFTLVELLLAVTLMSILLGLAYGGLRAATRASESGQALLEESGSVRTVHQFIRRQLNQMQPLPFEVTEDAEQTRIVFRGDSRSIQFVGPMPGYLGNGGPQVQLLQFAPGPDGTDELLFSHALLQDFEPERLFDRDPIVLLDDIESGSFEFLGRDGEGELTGWAPSWDDLEALPAVVGLQLEFVEGSPVAWPLLTTGVRVDEMAVSAGRELELGSFREIMRRQRDETSRDDR
jgi:general secretion pathway protein J